MSFQALYRKYRPQRFGELVGPGPRHHGAAQRGPRRPRRARVPLLRPARERQDHDRAHPRQGAQLPRARGGRRAVRRSARTASRSRRARSPTSSRWTPRRTAASTTIRDLVARVSLGLGATSKRKVYLARRGAHAHPGRVEHVAQDARGAARPRRVRARDHRARRRCSRRSGRARSTSSSAPHDRRAHRAPRVAARATKAWRSSPTR